MEDTDINKQQCACFIDSTLIMVADGHPWKRLDEIQIGDRVLALPENGMGEPKPKRVTNILKQENKAVWHLGISPYEDGVGELSESFAMTANALVCVYGNAPKVTEYPVHNPIDLYDNPRWKRVDELLVGDVIQGGSKLSYYLVCCVKPFSQSLGIEVINKKYAWLKGGIKMAYWQDEKKGSHWEVDGIKTFMPPIDGKIIEVGVQRDNSGFEVLNEKSESTPLYDEDGLTNEMRAGQKYAPYTTTVYQIEVEDNHTFCIGASGMVVHDMQEVTYDA